MNPHQERVPVLTRIVDVFLRGDSAVLLTIISLVIGLASLYLTPREEEPQIVVPMADVFVSAPGLAAEEVERLVTNRLEKLVAEIDGVEYVYSTSRPGQCLVTVRFYVGENREDSLVKLYNKLHSNLEKIPTVVSGWVVKPVEVDDVPIVNVTLWSRRPEYGDDVLRRLAEELERELKALPNTNRVTVIGGRPRQVRVELDPVRLAARQTSALEVANALAVHNVQRRAGSFAQQDQQFLVDAGTFVRDSAALGNLVVAVRHLRPVFLKEVATIEDGPAEPDQHSWIGFGPAADEPPTSGELLYPAVHLAIAKQKGTNAVWVARAIEQRLDELRPTLLPDGVQALLTRNYGATADEKVNELVESLVVAVLTVIGLIGIILGWRAALVIALAVPVCYSVTLFVNLLAGYTINRVTMFALILALGLLVDDPITDVENIARYFAMRTLPPRQAVLRAVQEVRPALILSTLAIIASFLPLAFITGMMGPYMAPMALNVPLTVTVSTVVSFMITPWMSMVALRRMAQSPGGEGFDITRRPIYRLYRAVLSPILERRWLSWAVLGMVGLIFAAALALPLFRVVPLKMLPYDNKNEFQIVIDMPEGTTLERTDAVARALAGKLSTVREVRDFTLYSGTSSPMDFNGLVRHYYLRRGANVADVRVNLAPKEVRVQQAHEILLRLRSELVRTARALGAKIKLVEVPPGPPVIATVTGEVYGPPDADYAALIRTARLVERRLQREPGIVDVDTSAEDEQRRWTFVTDKEKAALSGVSTADVARTLQLALDGLPATVLHEPGEANPLTVLLRLPRAARSAVDDLVELALRGQEGQMVRLGSIGRFVEEVEDQTIYHKNLRRVVYVFGEVAGRPPADAIIDMEFDRTEGGPGHVAEVAPRPAEKRTWLAPGGGVEWSLPSGFLVRWNGEGEWKITLDVFRDLGLAFAAALVAIFVILMFETRSRLLPVIIMLAIPLTMIGIMPGFWLLNAIVDRPIGASDEVRLFDNAYPNPIYFTATAMIGMIALAGIVVRNSVVLIDFIRHGKEEGLTLREAVIRSGAVRTRPIILTAGTTLLGNWVITLDPIFSGLAWAIIFGIFTSTIFTLLVVPVVYWLLFGNEAGAEAQ